jgi:hypothetical protein
MWEDVFFSAWKKNHPHSNLKSRFITSKILNLHTISNIWGYEPTVLKTDKSFNQKQGRPTQVGHWAADQLFSHDLGHFLSKT